MKPTSSRLSFNPGFAPPSSASSYLHTETSTPRTVEPRECSGPPIASTTSTEWVEEDLPRCRLLSERWQAPAPKGDGAGFGSQRGAEGAQRECARRSRCKESDMPRSVWKPKHRYRYVLPSAPSHFFSSFSVVAFRRCPCPLLNPHYSPISGFTSFFQLIATFLIPTSMPGSS